MVSAGIIGSRACGESGIGLVAILYCIGDGSGAVPNVGLPYNAPYWVGGEWLAEGPAPPVLIAASSASYCVLSLAFSSAAVSGLEPPKLTGGSGCDRVGRLDEDPYNGGLAGGGAAISGEDGPGGGDCLDLSAADTAASSSSYLRRSRSFSDNAESKPFVGGW